MPARQNFGMTMPYRAAIALALGSLLLAGCGLRGPLYLPDDERRNQEAALPADDKADPTQPVPAPQAQKRDRPASGSTPAN